MSPSKDQDKPFYFSEQEEQDQQDEAIFSSVPSSLPPPVPAAASSPSPRRATDQAGGAAPQRLELLDEQGATRRAFSLGAQRFWLGSHPECDAHLDDPHISPWHAMVMRTAEHKVMLHDVRSVNGVFLAIADAFQLEDGDEIALGAQRFVFRSRTEPPLYRHPAGPYEAVAMGAPKPPSGLYPHLVRLLRGGQIAALYPLDRALRIGRGAVEISCPQDLALDERHALIERRGPHFMLQDLGSRGGTYLRVHGSVELFPGDRFLIGGMQLSLR